MVESHPQWDFHDDEDEEEKKDEDADSESSISSDDELSDDYWTNAVTVRLEVLDGGRPCGRAVGRLLCCQDTAPREASVTADRRRGERDVPGWSVDVASLVVFLRL